MILWSALIIDYLLAIDQQSNRKFRNQIDHTIAVRPHTDSHLPPTKPKNRNIYCFWTAIFHDCSVFGGEVATRKSPRGGEFAEIRERTTEMTENTEHPSKDR